MKIESAARREKRLEKNRVKQALKRERRRNDPEAYAEYCEKERQRNAARKARGTETKFKKLEDLTDRERRMRRKKDAKNSRNYRLRLKKTQETVFCTPPPASSTIIHEHNEHRNEEGNQDNFVFLKALWKNELFCF